MIYQEINLPIWMQLVIIILLIFIGIEIAKIKPREPLGTNPVEEAPSNAVQSRYGAYIQSQGKYYN